MSQKENLAENQQTTTDNNMPTQVQEPGLTVQDLQALKAIIDVASSRGAFKPNEMVAVGQTYTKLEQFLVTVTSKDKE
jgi:hypothetical protein